MCVAIYWVCERGKGVSLVPNNANTEEGSSVLENLLSECLNRGFSRQNNLNQPVVL